MVWFQCEDCGENLKKPKLPNHFRICSASKLSCIDCGVMFRQDSVQSHTQCITEAEKYGPKGQVNSSNGTTPKPRKDSKQQPEIDINVGLSQRPPWFCSLCNTTATSKQTLLGHANGKKHRAKARAFHAAKQQLEKTGESVPETNTPIEKAKEELPDTKNQLEQKVQDLPEIENGHASEKSRKKRKAGSSGDDVGKGTASEELSNGVIGVKETKVEGTESLSKKAKQDLLKEHKMVESANVKDNSDHKIKWKKLIKLALKSNPDGVLKMKKLKKLVLKSLKESGVTGDENQLGDILEQKINSSSRFRVDKKLVRLVAKD